MSLRKCLRILLAIPLMLCSCWVNVGDEEVEGLGKETKLSVGELLGGDDSEGFARAMQPRRLEFPADHGPHPEYKHEWWYLTGNLGSLEGRRFGFQLTFFRIGLAPTPSERNSAWGTNQIYMAHFAITDVGASQFYCFERFSRGALGLAGASGRPFRIWLDDWSVEGETRQIGLLEYRAELARYTTFSQVGV